MTSLTIDELIESLGAGEREPDDEMAALAVVSWAATSGRRFAVGAHERSRPRGWHVQDPGPSSAPPPLIIFGLGKCWPCGDADVLLLWAWALETNAKVTMGCRTCAGSKWKRMPADVPLLGEAAGLGWERDPDDPAKRRRPCPQCDGEGGITSEVARLVLETWQNMSVAREALSVFADARLWLGDPLGDGLACWLATPRLEIAGLPPITEWRKVAVIALLRAAKAAQEQTE
jgi:hypothetical protein